MQRYFCSCQVSYSLCIFPGLAAPIRMSQSPQEMLGHYLDQSVAKHAAALQEKQSKIQASPEVLLADVRLLQIALLYERHRREVYARRNLQLLSRVAHFVSVTEQNEAIVSASIFVCFTDLL
jgi:Hamartin protein